MNLDLQPDTPKADAMIKLRFLLSSPFSFYLSAKCRSATDQYVKLKILVAVLVLVSINSALADSIGERWLELKITPEKLFHSPSTDLEKSLFSAGAYYHWIRYENTVQPNAETFKGYALFADPYHVGMSKISFLLGSDCSYFVHRLFQLLGAEYPYAKTRHFIALAKNEPVTDLTLCRVQKLKTLFEVTSTVDAKIGDLIVFQNNVGLNGENGHVGIITNTHPLSMISAKNSTSGIVEEKISGEDNFFIFSFKGPLNPLEVPDLQILLAKNYPSLGDLGCR